MTRTSRYPSASLLAISLATSLVSACGSDRKPAAPPPVEETAFRELDNAVDKARAVEGTVQQHKDAMDRAIEENENPTAR